MSRGNHPIGLFLLLALGCFLAGGTAEAAFRSAPPRATARCSGGWLSQLLGHLPLGIDKGGLQLAPDRRGCSKSGTQVDPDGSGVPKP